jgi:hypothetical protein
VPRAGWVKPESDQRLSDHISLGVLTRVFPPELVDRVVAETGRVERRHRLLPARVVVYYVLGLALFSQSSYEEVMRMLVEGHSWAQGWAKPWVVPSKAALFKARSRLGPQPMKALFAAVARPLAGEATRGAFYRRWRVMSIDGTVLDLADTAANDAEFGRPGSARGAGVGAFPQARVVGVAECGTHAVIDIAVGACTTAEVVLAEGLCTRFTPGMLVLADRGFYSFALWGKASATGADLLWRMKSNHVLPVAARLSDGSFLSTIYPSQADRRADRAGVTVRVIEYRITPADTTPADTTPPDTARAQLARSGAADPSGGDGDGDGGDVRYRMLTTILDPAAAPAGDLAALYGERWEIEDTLDELKTHQRSPRLVLRSKQPDGVVQEIYGYFCVHYAIRWLMHTVAHDADADPDRISFTRTLRAARRSTASHPGFSP